MAEIAGSPRTLEARRHVHFVGICGYAVSGAALLARDAGHHVTGSDEDAYPPTSLTLTAAGIPWSNRHDPANLQRWGSPGLVVVGNQVRAGNVEWQAAVARGIPITSEAEFYVELTGDRLRIAVCGTHGKTTTAALLSHMLAVAGMDPGMRLGSGSLDFGSASARLGTGPFVFEGDEYTTAPWDARPKFLHARARAACVTRIELDHPDVYPTLDAYRAPFVELARTLPADGLLALCADDPECVRLGARTDASVVTYGETVAAQWRIESLSGSPDRLAAGGAERWFQGFAVQTRAHGRMDVRLTAPGAHNRQNAAAALILADFAGAPMSACIEACATFRGPSRRFEVSGVAGGVTVVDDYAHHPTEVMATLAAARSRYRGRVHALYVPHTYSRTRALLEQYATSFVDADTTIIGPIEAARERPLAGTVSSQDVADRARKGCPDVRVVSSPDDALGILLEVARPGDVVLCLSVRGFDGVAGRLVAALEASDGR